MAAGRKEDLKQATVYLCINDIRFTKRFYLSTFKEFFAFDRCNIEINSLYFGSCQDAENFLQDCNEGEKYKAEG